MAKTKKKNRRHNRFTLSVAIMAGMAPILSESANIITTSLFPRLTEKGRRLGQLWAAAFTGYDFIEKRFRWDLMATHALPIVGGVIAHKFIGQRLGVNRMLASANVPVIRL